ncbi:DMT family transporter [Kitasatospora sp. NPDC059571]|uniref:DMT family transporter n=1 Tax=Kitasatospora sp. NPDC059571 TaxID=3346871 RepID=UPI00367FDF76
MDSTPIDRPAADRRAHAAAAVTVLLWASAFVAIRDAGGHFGPGALALGRLLTGSVALVALLLHRGEGLPRREAWPGIAISGAVWFGVYMVVLNWGEQLVDAGTAAMVVNTGPLLIALLGGVLLHEGFPRMLVAGMAVSFTGAVVVGLSTSGPAGARTPLGIGLCLLAAATYAAGVVAQKPALGYASPLQVTAFGCLTGAVLCLPFTPQLLHDLGRAPAGAVLDMVYLGLFPTALACTTWAYALARTTAGRMGATTYAVPALVVLMAWAVLDEVPPLPALAGGALCLAGVAVSRLRPAAAVTAPAGAGAPRRTSADR